MRAERRTAARGARVRLAWLLAMVLSGVASGAPLVPERVAFDSLDSDPATGAPVRIAGLLFRPEGGGGERRAAVVALHGCGGMYSTSRSRPDALSLRHQAMAEFLVGEGYVVLFPDSFRARGRSEICTVEYRRRTIREANRRLDAQGALAFLQARGDVAPDRVAVLGWSHGGSAVLATLDLRQPAVAAWPRSVPPSPYFRAGVAFYPGCAGSMRGRREYALAAPLRLFVAGSDDWTPPGPCVDLAHRLAAAGEPVKITVYPETFHGFDAPTGPPWRRVDVPNGVRPGTGVTVAASPAARADAYVRLAAFLHAQLREAGSAGGRP